MSMLNRNFKKILGEILVCHTGGSGANNLLTTCMLNLNFFKKILGEILVCHTWGSIIFWPCPCWIYKNNLGEILVCHTGGSGVNNLLTTCMLNLNFKTILGEILACHVGSIIFWPCTGWIWIPPPIWQTKISPRIFCRFNMCMVKRWLTALEDRPGSHLEFF